MHKLKAGSDPGLFSFRHSGPEVRSTSPHIFFPSFRGDAKHRTRNLEIPGLVLRTIPE